MRFGFAQRLTLTLAALLLVFGAAVATLGRQAALDQEIEAQQALARGLAGHIVAHWPEIAETGTPDRAVQHELLRMLMIVNPNIQVYLLDQNGRVDAYIGEPGMVRTEQVDLPRVRAFLGGADLPLLGTDPMGGPDRIFSAAMFPPGRGQAQPSGYLYVVLEGSGKTDLVQSVAARTVWRRVLWTVAMVAGALLLVGGGIFSFLTMPLNRLARRMRAFDIDEPSPTLPPDRSRTEVGAIRRSFDALAARLGEQARARADQSAQHRDIMAGVAHDLRTPLTALHGYLEALTTSPADPGRGTLLTTALAQSEKVRRLTQQLFELATLQGADQPPSSEMFLLDELVADTVQKFQIGATRLPVTLAGPAPGSIPMAGDAHLIERALTNLIDNAIRHAGSVEPVRVTVRGTGGVATVLIEDGGPGLPPELAQRLHAGVSVREPPMRRAIGGLGGFGLAVAQRIAVIHGGSLKPLPTVRGTRLALAFPLQVPDGI